MQFGLLHVKAVDDAGHDRNVEYRVAYLQAVDLLLRQLVARLRAHELASGVRYVVGCTGDHSTPVLFGDHSNEPVPFAVAHLADFSAALGGDAHVLATPLGPIRTPEFDAPSTPPCPAAGPPAGDGVRAFDELSCAAGGLGRFCGMEMMPLLSAFAQTRAEVSAV